MKRWAVVTALLSVLAACDGSPSDTVVCPPDTSLYSREPYSEPDDVPPPVIPHFNERENAFYMRPVFPPDAHGGVNARTYWLTDDEDLAFDLYLSNFPARESKITTASLFIDGRQLPLSVDGKPPQPNVAVVTDGTKTSKYSLKVDHALVSPGAHVAALLLREVWRPEWTGLRFSGGDFPFSWPFSVVKNGTALVPREPLAAAKKEPFDRLTTPRLSCSPCTVSE